MRLLFRVMTLVSARSGIPAITFCYWIWTAVRMAAASKKYIHAIRLSLSSAYFQDISELLYAYISTSGFTPLKNTGLYTTHRFFGQKRVWLRCFWNRANNNTSNKNNNPWGNGRGEEREIRSIYANQQRGDPKYVKEINDRMARGILIGKRDSKKCSSSVSYKSQYKWITL